MTIRRGVGFLRRHHNKKCKAHCIFGSPKIPAFSVNLGIIQEPKKSLKSLFEKNKKVNNLIFRAKNSEVILDIFGHQYSRQISESLLRSKNTLYSTQVPF